MSTRNFILTFKKTIFNEKLVSKCSFIKKDYKSFISGSHLETIWGNYLRKSLDINYNREILNLPDGGTIALDWLPNEKIYKENPILILIAGLGGGSSSNYVEYAVNSAPSHGMSPVVFNCRGTGNTPVTSAKIHSASYTDDLKYVINYIKCKHPTNLLVAMGWSLGANILVNYIGESKQASKLVAAVSLANPFNLVKTDQVMNTGFCRIYNYYLCNNLKKLINPYYNLFKKSEKQYKLDELKSAASVRDFDKCITIHSFGFNTVDEYYEYSGSHKAISNVKIPLFCIQALNDPISVPESIPYDAIEENEYCLLMTTESGGHVGWVDSSNIFGAPWSNDVSLEWLSHVLNNSMSKKEY